MKTLALYSLILLAGFTAWAQQAAPSPSVPPLPRGPLLKRAPDFAQWEIAKFHSTKNPAKPGAGQDADETAHPESPKRVSVTKTGEMRHLVAIDPDGSRSKIWFKGDLEVVCQPGWKFPWLAKAHDPHNPFAIDFSRTDFPECGWVSARNYRGIQKVQGRDCILFSERVTIVPDPDNPDSNIPQISGTNAAWYGRAAFVDLETRLPVTEVTSGEITTYQFGTPPQTMLTFPADIQKTIDTREAELKRETSEPPRPY